jgi:hypothetical protein
MDRLGERSCFDARLRIRRLSDSVHDVKQPLDSQALTALASAAGRSAVTSALARRRLKDGGTAQSYHDGRSSHRLEGLAQALDARIHLVGRAEIEDEHVVVPAVNDRARDGPRAQPAVVR